jgi:hypothetical protein
LKSFTRVSKSIFALFTRKPSVFVMSASVSNKSDISAFESFVALSLIISVFATTFQFEFSVAYFVVNSKVSLI